MKRQLAGIGRYLMSQPVGDGLMAGPSFEIVDLGPDPDAALRDLAVRAVAGHPDLASVAGKLVS
jgi:hypothetical protein